MDIPQFPQSREVMLEDRPRLSPLFWELQPRTSELTFPNIFLFRKVHEYRLTMVKDAVVALGKGYDGTDYFLPPLSGDIAAAAFALIDGGLTLYGADDIFLDRYLKGTDLLITEDRDNFDYLHIKEEMALLHGRAYHRKKNHVNYFMLRHHHEVETYDRDRHLDGAQALLAEWFRVRSAMEPGAASVSVSGAGSVKGEVCGAAEALRLDRELGLQGIVVMVEGAVKGFALGEQLNSDTAVCHFEKGDLFIDGLSQFLDREFARLLFTDCRYLNREQDLGSESLRQSKLSYRPIELVKKYRVRLP